MQLKTQFKKNRQTGFSISFYLTKKIRKAQLVPKQFIELTASDSSIFVANNA